VPSKSSGLNLALGDAPSKAGSLSLVPLGGAGGSLVSDLRAHSCMQCAARHISIYCLACGTCGSKCADCGEEEQLGALDTVRNRWYCKACWIRKTPAGAEGPFKEGDDDAPFIQPKDFLANRPVAPSSGLGLNGLPPAGGQPALPGIPDASADAPKNPAEDATKKALWGQVFATMQQTGQTNRALEYAQSLRKLRGAIQDLHAKYKDAVSSEDELLQTAYTEALQAYQVQQEAQAEAEAQDQLQMQADAMQQQAMDAAYREAIELQVQAHQEVEAKAKELQQSVQEAHQKAAQALANQEIAAGRSPGRLPRRPGVSPCEFYLRTGECAYGLTCKWDHPTDRLGPKLNAVGLPLRPGESNCTFYMRTGKCSFGQTCKWNHPDMNQGGMGMLGFFPGGAQTL